MNYRVQITIASKVYPISRDVSHHHPREVHEALGTASESELQNYLDGLNVSYWYRDGRHLGPDTAGMEMFDETIEHIREFLSLPVEALPGAMFMCADDSWADDAYEVLRECVRTIREPEAICGSRIRLHAARDGWRDGVIV